MKSYILICPMSLSEMGIPYVEALIEATEEFACMPLRITDDIYLLCASRPEALTNCAIQVGLTGAIIEATPVSIVQ